MFNYQLLIPAFNAESTLPQLLESVSRLDEAPQKIIVIDDGSDDETSKTAEHYNVALIQNKTNRGKGYSLQRGFRYFLDQDEVDYLLCMDADLQHPVAFIPEFIRRTRESKMMLLIGNRSKNISEMPFLRVLSNRITSAILTRLTGQKIKDSQCGFRLIHRDVIRAIELSENGFQMESEFIIEAARRHFPIRFIEIPTIYNQEHSYISHINDTFRFIRLVLKELI